MPIFNPWTVSLASERLDRLTIQGCPGVFDRGVESGSLFAAAEKLINLLCWKFPTGPYKSGLRPERSGVTSLSNIGHQNDYLASREVDYRWIASPSNRITHIGHYS